METISGHSEENEKDAIECLSKRSWRAYYKRSVKRVVYSSLKEGNYHAINIAMAGYTLRREAKFYVKESEPLLVFALFVYRKSGPLKFILRKVPKDIIGELLCKDDFELLHSYLRMLIMHTEQNKLSDKRAVAEREKVLTLVEFDEQIRAFIEDVIPDIKNFY